MKLVRFARDVLSAVGAYTALAYFGHPEAGLGMAYIVVGLAVACRLPGVYAPGDAGSLGPHDG